MSDTPQPSQSQPQPPQGAPVNAAPAPAPAPAQPAAPKPKKNRKGVKTFFIAFAGAAVACVLALGIFVAVNPSNSGYTIKETNSGITIDVDTDDMSLAEAVAAKTLPSVVNINVYANTSQQSMSPFGMLGGPVCYARATADFARFRCRAHSRWLHPYE